MKLNSVLSRIVVATATIPVWGANVFALQVSAGSFQESIGVAELQAAWRECDATRKFGEWEIVEVSSIDGSEPSTGPIVNFKYDGTQFVIVESFADGRRKALGLNHDYRFMLDAAPGSPFRIKRMFSADEIDKIRETEPEAFALWESNMENLGRHFGLMFTRSDWWTDIVTSGGFRILSTRFFKRNNMSVIEIQFECIPNDEERDRKSHPVPIVRNASAVLFDKDRYFLPLETKVEFFDKSGAKKTEVQIAKEYDFDFGPVPQLCGHVIQAKGKGREIEDRYTIRVISVGNPINSDEFRLTAFDIPEPKGLKLPSKGWPWWVKLSLAGIVAVGIAALFKRSINQGKK